jgi:hypothetical protein
MNWLESRKNKMKDEIPIMLNESYARSYQMAYDFIKRHASEL